MLPIWPQKLAQKCAMPFPICTHSRDATSVHHSCARRRSSHSEIVEKSKEFQHSSSELGNDSPRISQEDCQALEKFICVLYGKPKLTSVDEVCFVVFCDKYKPHDEQKPLQNIKSCDESLFSPCQSVLRQKILQANYVASLCKK